MDHIPLDRWILGKDEFENSTPKKYFILEWDKNKTDSYWSNEKPEKYNFIKKIKWRIGIGYSIYLIGNIDTDINKIHKYEGLNYNISFLKSHLQKCIRKSLIQKSIDTAYSLFHLDYVQLIRRLPIIILEDSTLIKEYPTIIWLMATSSEYVLEYEYQLQWLLAIIKKIASSSFRDRIEKDEFDFIKNIKYINNIKDKFTQTLIYSLELRKTYGGMKNDLKMISYFIKLWNYRLNCDKYKKWIDILNTPVNTNLEYNSLKIIDIEIVGIDFHCYPKILTELKIKHKNIDIQDLKKTIWYIESSVNNKNIIDGKVKKIKEKYYKIWNEIENNVYIIRNNYLKNNLIGK